MSKVLPFKKPSQKERAKKRTLCGRGFHKWQVDKTTQFDVKRGKLVTLRRCMRCGATRTSAD